MGFGLRDPRDANDLAGKGGAFDGDCWKSLDYRARAAI